MMLARPLLALAQDGIVIYFLLLNTVVALLLIVAIRELWNHWHVADDEHLAAVLASDALPPLSILVTAHGAPAATSEEVLSYLALEHPRHEVILVTDGVPDVLAQEFVLYQVPPAVMVTVPTAPVRGYYRSRRYSKLLIIDKEAAGRADALNAAVNAARYPYVLAMNTGTRLAHDALLRLARPFLLGKSIAVVGGAIRVAAGGPAAHPGGVRPGVVSRWLRGVQTVESLRVHVFSRLGWNPLCGSRDMSGAVGLFLRDHVLEVGGYRVSAAAADSDLVTRVYRYLHDQGAPAEVCFVPEPVAWAAPATTRRELVRQRERRHRGLIELLASNRDLLFRSRYGATGLLMFPYLLIGEVLAPVVELAGFLCLVVALFAGGAGWGFVGLFLLAALGYATLHSVWAILLERSSAPPLGGVRPGASLFFWALVEPIGYRQMLLWARLRTSWRFLRGRHSWSGTPRDVAVGRGSPLSEGI
jgi:cellulose synthase/poly-beta-1,6-N-acetylglucosamine synthase-like glycosyltransferase